MALITGALTEAGQKDTGSVREDLMELLSVIDSKTCPLTTRIRNGSAPANTLVEWQVDEHEAPNTDGALEMNDTDSFEDFSNRQRLNNYVQIFERSPAVGRLAEDVSNVAGNGGTKREMAKMVGKALETQKRDIESTFCSDNVAKTEAGNQPYMTRGLGAWIQDKTSALALGDDLYGSASTLTYWPDTAQFDLESTAVDAFTDENIRDQMESIWNHTGATGQFLALCGSAVKKRISELTGFVPQAQLNYNQPVSGQNKVERIIDIVSTDFGQIELAMSQFLRHGSADSNNNAHGPRTLYILDMDKLEARWTRKPTFTEHENKGAGRRGLVESICALVVHNPKAHAQAVYTV